LGSTRWACRRGVYNLLVTCDDGAWDRDAYVFSASRYLEHTEPEVAERFKPLDERVRSELMALPTLFAYEAPVDRDARVGRIRSIHRRRSEIRVTFSLDATVAPVSPTKLDSLAWELEIGGAEMSRTHWAVKAVDLLGVLNGHQPLAPDIPPYAQATRDSNNLHTDRRPSRPEADRDGGVRAKGNLELSVDHILRAQAADIAVTAGFRERRHDPMLNVLRTILEAELVGGPRISILQSLQDRGCDLLIEWPGHAKYGVQLKSNGDVAAGDFATKTLAQIQDSRQHGLERLYVVLAADITSESNQQKVRALVSRISAMNDPYVAVVPPENAWNLLARSAQLEGEREKRSTLETEVVSRPPEVHAGVLGDLRVQGTPSEDGTIDLLAFELERLRDAAEQRGGAACEGSWTALTGATYDCSQLKQNLPGMLRVLSPDPEAKTLLREVLHFANVGDATAESMPSNPDKLHIRDLRHRSAEAAEQVYVKATQLLRRLRPDMAAVEPPAFLATLEEQDRQERYSQRVSWAMAHGAKFSRHSDQETRRAGVPYRVNFNGKFYEVHELLELLGQVVKDASSTEDELAFWALLGAARNLRRATWDLMRDWPGCPWSKDDWLPLAERFAALEESHREGGNRFWDEPGGVGERAGEAQRVPGGIEDSEFFQVGAKYAPEGMGPARLAADAKRKGDLAATLRYAQMALDSDAYAIAERAAGRVAKRDNVSGNAWSGFVQQVTDGRLKGW